MTCRRWRTWLASALVALLPASPASAQDEPAPPRKIVVNKRGVQGFTLLLNALKLRPIKTFDDWIAANPEETVAIFFGNPTPVDQMRDNLAEFARNGGALMIASDRPILRALEASFKVQIPGGVVRQPHNAYKGIRECPLISRFDAKHPLFQGVQKLATNSPSHVIRAGGIPEVHWLSELASFDPFCVSDRFGRLDTPAAFIMGSDATSRNRVLVIGGHSVFMNVLVAQNDNDNFSFAENSVRWLTDNGKRTRCLFVVDDRIVTSFDVPLGGVPLPTVKMINKMLQRMEEERIFDRVAQAFIPRIFAMRAVLIAITLFLAIYSFWRLWGKRHDVPREAPLLSAKVAQTVPDRTVLALRQQALVHEDNLWEVGRSLARQCFGRHGIAGTESPKPPEIRCVGRWSQRRERAARVRALWKLAFGPPKEKLRARDFPKMLADVEAVDGWLDDGLVRLESPTLAPQPGRGLPEVSTN